MPAREKERFEERRFPAAAWQRLFLLRRCNNNNKLVLILTRHTLARAGLANRLLDRHEVVTIGGDVVTLRQATP